MSMERPFSQLKEMSDEGDTRRLSGQKPRRNSLTPSMRHGAGNVIEHTSALEEEIAHRRAILAGLNDEDLSKLAALPSPSSTPALSYPSSPNPSRRGSLEAIEDPHTPRRARPSFISLAPQGSRPGSRDSLAPPTPTSPTLRARHSSPHLPSNVKPNPELGPANWMTAAPVSSFSRTGVHGSGVILPVKASSRAGEQIRQKSTPNRPVTVAAKADTHSQSSPKPRSLKSFRSMSRILRTNSTAEYEEGAPAMPTSPASPSRRSYSSSFDFGAREIATPLHQRALSHPATPTMPMPMGDSFKYMPRQSWTPMRNPLDSLRTQRR
ncbi:hypothetical protein OPQ81_003377 [Rhizoctonia solani]|nr:hypothetical protein OPQ81_003377 [Rhizoctonia solani]